MIPLFQDEVQFATYTDSSRAGPRITLRLADRDQLQAFIGKEGKRFACVLVEIADDETPAEPPKSAAAPKVSPELEKPKGGPLARLAGQWCASEEFVEWLFHVRGWPATDDAGAAQWVRQVCGIESRAELDSNPEAAAVFHREIRAPYAAHLQSIGRA